jgi:predicted DNA-binding antitoxin AbrB/MazE fold protein
VSRNEEPAPVSNIIQAIYEQGVFRPTEPVDLPERTYVEFEPRIVREAMPSVAFWKSQSLDELAAQQGVSPVSDLDEISALWPADDDPDELLEHVQHERELRRRLNRESRE